MVASIVWLIADQAYFAVQCNIPGIYTTACRVICTFPLAHIDNICELDMNCLLFAQAIKFLKPRLISTRKLPPHGQRELTKVTPGSDAWRTQVTSAQLTRFYFVASIL